MGHGWEGVVLKDPEVVEPADFIGVDRGIVNLATTSDATNYQGRRLNRCRRWHARKRAQLQAVGTRSAKRRLARRAGKETAFCHACEPQDLQRDRVRRETHRSRDRRRSTRRHPGPGTASTRPAGHALLLAVPQLGQHLRYKARRAGVPFLEVDPAYTSQRCPRCGHTERANRPTRDRPVVGGSRERDKV